MRQYTLPFAQTARNTEENFFVSPCNEVAHQRITTWPSWTALLLLAPPGAGKTHLGSIWAARASALVVRCGHDTLTPESIAGNMLIEDIEQCEEEALLHAINLCKEQQFSLLLTACKPIKQLHFTLPDLTSRLLALPTTTIEKPDDEVLAGVMRKQFADRQIGANEEVVQYLITHTERSFAAISHMIATLDKTMWQEKKSLTIPFVRKILQDSSADSSNTA